MVIEEWEYEFSKLPRWDNRDKIPWVYDKLYENPNRNNAVLIYSIAEVGIGKYFGFLAVFSNKAQPHLTLNTTAFTVIPQMPMFSANGDICFLLACLYEKRKNLLACPLLILNFELEAFNCFKVTDGFNYSVDEKNKAEFVLVQQYHNDRLKSFDGQIIRIDQCNWKPFSELHTLAIDYWTN